MNTPALFLCQHKTAAYLRPDPLPPPRANQNGIGLINPNMSVATLSELETGMNDPRQQSPEVQQAYKKRIQAHMAANRPPMMAEIPTGPSALGHFVNSAKQIRDTALRVPGQVGDAASNAGVAAGTALAPMVSGMGEQLGKAVDVVERAPAAINRGFQAWNNPPSPDAAAMAHYRALTAPKTP